MSPDTVTTTPERLRLCIQAAYRIEALANLLKRNASNNSDEDEFVIEEVSLNIADLAGIVMSAAGDENDPTEEIASRLYRGGRGLAVASAAATSPCDAAPANEPLQHTGDVDQREDETLALAIALQDRIASHSDDPTAKHLAEILVRTAGGLSADC
jgi:hypothetical protein